MICRSVIVIAALTGGFLLFLSHARGHSFYSWECCSDRDCAPYPASDVEEKPEGFVLKPTGEFIEREKTKLAPDGQFHLCRNPITQTIICFYMPFRGA